MPKTAVPSILRKITPNQLAAVRVMLERNLMLDITQRPSYSVRREARTVGVAYPETSNRPAASEALRRALTGKVWGSGFGHRVNQLGTSLLAKNLLVKVAEIRPEQKNEHGHITSHAVMRYTLANTLREAAGAIPLALDALAQDEQRRVDREQAWRNALVPLSQERRMLQEESWALQRNLTKKLDDPTPDALIEAHAAWQALQVKLADLNARLAATAVVHGRRSAEPFTF